MLTTGIIIAVLFLAFRVLLPGKVELKDVSLPKRKFRKIYGLTYLLLIILIPFFSWLIYLSLTRLSVESTEGLLYNLYPDRSLWVIAAGITGFTLGIIIAFGLLKVYLKDQYNDFWSLYDAMYAFRAFSLLKGFLLLFGIAAATLTLLSQRAHFKVFENRIEVSRLLEWSSHVFEYEEIKALNYRLSFIAPSGKVVYRPHFEIVFDGDYYWNTRIDLREPDEQDAEVFQYISSRAEIKIEEKE